MGRFVLFVFVLAQVVMIIPSCTVGGVKVDSFIYSPLLDERVRGSTYGGIMHVSDWMPTMLELAGIDYTPAAGHAFDGYSQVSAMTGLTAKNPREFLVYNMYLNVQKQSFSMFGNAALAVRNYRYKLIHAFINNPSSKWYSFAEPNTDDWDYTSGSCPQFLALVGGYTYFLFDLQTDPNETKNLYNIAAYSTIKVCPRLFVIMSPRYVLTAFKFHAIAGYIVQAA